MTNTITDLWRGDLAPCDQCGAQNPQINRIHILLEQHQQSLCGTLTPEQRLLFERFVDCGQDYLIRLMEQAFCDGFSLSSGLLIDALSNV